MRNENIYVSIEFAGNQNISGEILHDRFCTRRKRNSLQMVFAHILHHPHFTNYISI